MERIKKEQEINPVTKLHIIYGSVIMFLSLTFTVTLFTMKNSYDTLVKSTMAGQVPEGHPDVSSGSEGAPAASGGMPSGGGMPPFLKKMLEEYKTALEKNPKDVKALSGLANMYYDSGQYEKAIPFYEKVIEIDPNASNIITDLGTCFFYIQKNDEAIKYFKMGIEKDPKNMNARYNLGIVYKSTGKTDLARSTWEEMMKHLTTDEEKKKLQSVLDELDKNKS